MSHGTSAGLVLSLGLLAAGSNLLGGRIALLRPRVAQRHLVHGLAFSGGFLLAVALLLILPECLRATPAAPALILAGYFLVYFAEHVYAGHAHHVATEPHGAHPLVGTHGHEGHGVAIARPAAAAATAGLLLHSFFDGAAIAAALASGSAVGWLTFFAVVLHKVPEGYSIASIVLSTGGTRRSAARVAAALGASSLVGTVTVLLAARVIAGLEPVCLGIAGGMFLHISATDLLPTTSHVRGLTILGATAAGALAVVLAEGLFRLAGF
jgi:ZIP family zinc transporter/zinc and cadmium transporter